MADAEPFESLDASEQVACLRDKKGVTFELAPEGARWSRIAEAAHTPEIGKAIVDSIM